MNGIIDEKIKRRGRPTRGTQTMRYAKILLRKSRGRQHLRKKRLKKVRMTTKGREEREQATLARYAHSASTGLGRKRTYLRMSQREPPRKERENGGFIEPRGDKTEGIVISGKGPMRERQRTQRGEGGFTSYLSALKKVQQCLKNKQTTLTKSDWKKKPGDI